jgi:hypothetical protein
MNERQGEISWQCPNFESDDKVKLAFCKRAIESGVKWNEDQMSSVDIKRGVDILAGKSGSALTGKWANITTGDLKRAVNEIVETLSNIRPFWGYQTNNDAFKDEANMMNKVTKSVYLESFVDRSLHDALQFAAVTGGGFIYPFYSRSKFGSGDGEFVFMPLGQPDVLPVQLPRSRDYQKAYVVTLAVPYGVADAHARFPLFQWALRPFANKRYAKTPGGEQRRGYDQNRWKMHSIDTQLEQFCDVYFSYVLDLRVNFGALDPQGKPILDDDGNAIGTELSMGQEGTSWFYKVPFVGQMITVFENSQEVTRAADVEDCRVYPNRRLMISCDQALMYDGPAFDMHGMVPLIPFYFDKWAWGEAFSLFRGTASLQDAIDDLVRSVYRIAMSRANPGKSYNTDITSGDKNAKLSSRQAEAIDPFAPDMTFGVDGDVKEPVMRPPMPEWCYNVPEWVLKVVEILQQSIAKQLGLDQIQSLQKLKANIDDPKKLLDAEGPVVTGASRGMEMGLRDLGEMQKYNIIQYMPVGTIMNYTGASGIAPQVFDYSPEMVIPSHLPGETTFDSSGELVPSKADPMTRARYFAKNLKFFITPHSLHYIAQKEHKLNLLAAKDKGVVIDPMTMAETFDIPNWGTIEGSTVKERVFNWAKEQLTEKADLAKLEKALGLGQPPPEGPGQGKTGGRPASNKKPPRVKQKSAKDGGRVVLSTSG